MFRKFLIIVLTIFLPFQSSFAQQPKKKRKLSRIQKARLRQQERMRRDRESVDSMMMDGISEEEARNKVLSKQHAPKQKLKKVYKKTTDLKKAKKKEVEKEESFDIEEEDTTVSVLDAYDDQGNLKQKPKPKEEPKEEEGSVLDSYMDE